MAHPVPTKGFLHKLKVVWYTYYAFIAYNRLIGASHHHKPMDAIRVQQSNTKAKHKAFWQFERGSGALVEWESLVLSSWVSGFLWRGVVTGGDGQWAFKRNLPFKKQVWAVPFLVTQVMMSSMGLRTCTKTSYGDAAVPGHQSKMNWTEPILKSEFTQPVPLPGGSCHSLLRCRPGASLIRRG